MDVRSDGMDGRTGPDVRFRKHVQGDIRACARLARQAWPARPGTASKEVELAGMEGYMQYSLESSNWTDIAYTDEGVVAFLFGRIDGYPEVPAPERSALGEIPSLIRSLVYHEDSSPRLLAFVLSLALTELKLKLRTPWSDSSIEMFIVDSDWRGKGIGSLLFERFVKAAKDSGSRVMTVYTEDMMSDWRFYERRGFRRAATFHDNITSHYSGSRTTGIIYTLDLARYVRGKERA